MANEIMKAPTGRDTLVEIRLHPETYPRLCRLQTEFAVEGLKKIYCMAVMYRGQDIDAAKADFTARTLLSELLEEDKFGAKYLTLEEIRRAVKNAVLNDAEVYGINVASLYKIIMSYVKGEGHAANDEACAIKKAQDRAAAENKAADTMIAIYSSRMSKSIKTR